MKAWMINLFSRILLIVISVSQARATVRVSRHLTKNEDRAERVPYRLLEHRRVRGSDAETMEKPSRATIRRHRELFTSTVQNFLCKKDSGIGGVAGVIGILVTLLTFGLIRFPGHGGGNSKSKSKEQAGQRHRNLYSLKDIRKLLSPKYLNSLSESEREDLVNNVLRQLEWVENDNPDFHGRKLFNVLEKLGIINCAPTCNSSTCVSPQCVFNGEGFTAEFYACVGTECVFTGEFTFCDTTCTNGVGCA